MNKILSTYEPYKAIKDIEGLGERGRESTVMATNRQYIKLLGACSEYSSKSGSIELRFVENIAMNSGLLRLSLEISQCPLKLRQP